MFEDQYITATSDAFAKSITLKNQEEAPLWNWNRWSWPFLGLYTTARAHAMHCPSHDIGWIRAEVQRSFEKIHDLHINTGIFKENLGMRQAFQYQPITEPAPPPPTLFPSNSMRKKGWLGRIRTLYKGTIVNEP